MFVTYRQSTGRRRPLHVGRIHYGRLRAGHRLGPLAILLRAVAEPVAAALNRFRPSPMADGPLLGMALLAGLAGLAAAGLVGLALAGWVATSADDAAPALVGAAIVGVMFLGLFFLVFASKRRRSAGRADS